MRIGELAEHSGVSVRSLRYYEQQGMLVPQRTPAGQRIFRETDVGIVRQIQELFGAGFCSSVIRELVPALNSSETDKRELADAFLRARSRLVSERAAVERELTRLESLSERLGLAPDMHVRGNDAFYDDNEPTQTNPSDHRDRRLR